MIAMRSKEVTGWVALLIKQPHRYVLTIIVSLQIVSRLVKVTLNCLAQLMANAMITELGELVGNVVQDTLYHMTPTDCISVNQCSAGWTVLVIILTCLYWIAVVAGVFSLMYFRFQISLGYLYGLIYYYSMVGILLNNNPYVSDGAFQFTTVLSSFAQLTPQFLGKLCFVKGLNGIDQLFIHYSHAVGVSLLLLLIVVAARYSARVSLFVSRCIIRVICLLILLSYTSIASTSLQLLLPLRFTDVEEFLYLFLSKYPIFPWTAYSIWYRSNNL